LSVRELRRGRLADVALNDSDPVRIRLPGCFARLVVLIGNPAERGTGPEGEIPVW
jgi:hypothetical protein